MQLRDAIDDGIRSVMSTLPTAYAEPSLLHLQQLSDAAAEDWLDPRYVVGEEVLTMISNRWEAGWQPADLLHYLRRATPRVDQLGATAIHRQLQRSGLLDKAPPEWRQQLAAVGDLTRSGAGRGRGWLFPADLDPPRAWRQALILMARLRQMHRLAPLGPPPSQWRATTSSPRDGIRGAAEAGPRPAPSVLDKVRGLLAKAESTTFTAEAEALTAKAQELMTRHAIDEALLQTDRAADDIDVSARRLHIDNPYASTKATLVHCVAEANRVRAVWDDRLGACTIIGQPTDLETVDLLFTSLLVQAARAMNDHGRDSRSGSADRSRSFRRSFLLAYANRIGERLAETSHDVATEYGAELVPVLARRQEAVDEEFRRMFPSVSHGRTRSVDRRGWAAGTAAADQAVLPRGRLGRR
ncbi:Protein of unknown function [Microlunatus soli]|uniref:Uncharacterized protein n=2 Tax=Microlunatus soli TaxID=630515 RepID=A0A1H1XI23_9ACTN|nr:Protein of unknown function [Microlunatus soli]